MVFDKIHTQLDQGHNSKPITVLDYLQFMIFFAVNDCQNMISKSANLSWNICMLGVYQTSGY
jgi:hypothetical protein